MGPGQAGGAHFSVLCYSPLPIFRGGYWLPIDIKLVEFLSSMSGSFATTVFRRKMFREIAHSALAELGSTSFAEPRKCWRNFAEPDHTVPFVCLSVLDEISSRC